MKRISKIIVCVILCFAMIVPTLSQTVFSVGFHDGLVALRAQWSRDIGPETAGVSIDYSYYSPVKNSNDTTKYPLCIFLAGAGEGISPGYELQANNFAYWSSAEFQNRFRISKGSFLLIARAPQDPFVCWDKAPISSLKAAIDDFAERNPNVDSSRIYLVSWCLGAVGATKLLTNYPGYFAAAMLHANPHAITTSEAKKMKTTAIWLLNCKNDTYSFYQAYCATSWENLKKTTESKKQLRLTTCDSAPDTAMLLQHDVWEYTALDCTQNGGCEGLETINGNGTKITNVSAIDWISRWQLPDSEEPTEPSVVDDENLKEITGDEFICPCDCHANNLITRLIFLYKTIIYRLLGLNSYRVCECGIAHW